MCNISLMSVICAFYMCILLCCFYVVSVLFLCIFSLCMLFMLYVFVCCFIMFLFLYLCVLCMCIISPNHKHSPPGRPHTWLNPRLCMTPPPQPPIPPAKIRIIYGTCGVEPISPPFSMLCSSASGTRVLLVSLTIASVPPWWLRDVVSDIVVFLPATHWILINVAHAICRPWSVFFTIHKLYP